MQTSPTELPSHDKGMRISYSGRGTVRRWACNPYRSSRPHIRHQTCLSPLQYLAGCCLLIITPLEVMKGGQCYLQSHAQSNQLLLQVSFVRNLAILTVFWFSSFSSLLPSSKALRVLYLTPVLPKERFYWLHFFFFFKLVSSALTGRISNGMYGPYPEKCWAVQTL